MQLPAELREKIDNLLGTENRAALSTAATDVSLKYRRETTNSLQIESLQQAKAYVATRLPATWCAVTNVLNSFLEIEPDFAPHTMLDLGAGPGTATLAAAHLWPDIRPTLVEPNENLRHIGQSLVGGNWEAKKLENFQPQENYDLVIASYVFNELSNDFMAALQSYWDKTEAALILIEPGTPQGYQTIMKARKFFLGIGAAIAAPCPHELTCPLEAADRWCHFNVRVDRSRLHRQVKENAQLSYEDEKFSYLIVTRKPYELPRFRALGHPHGQKVVTLETCQSDGQFTVMQVSKRDDDYKLIRKMDWGDKA